MRLFMLLGLLFCALYLKTFAQLPAIQWQKTIGSSSYDYLRTNLSVDSRKIHLRANNGNILVAGTCSAADGDFAAISGTGGIFLGELDNAGNWVWKKRYSGLTNADEVVSVQPAIGGGYIVLGNTYSNDSSVVVGNHGGGDAWVFKIDDAASFTQCMPRSAPSLCAHHSLRSFSCAPQPAALAAASVQPCLAATLFSFASFNYST